MTSPASKRSKQITVRSVDPRLDAALKREARRRSQSVNRTVLDLLRKATGVAPDEAAPPEKWDDLDHLAGTWSAAQADELDRALAEQRRVDPKLWR